MGGVGVSVRLSIWFEGVKWRIRNGRRVTLRWWYLVLAGVLVAWLGVAEVLAAPAYGGYAHEVFANLLAGAPTSPPAAVQVTVFQWSCSVVWLMLAYRQWARRQFAWMIVSMVCSLLYVPFVVYLVHEIRDQRRGIARLEEKPDAADPTDDGTGDDVVGEVMDPGPGFFRRGASVGAVPRRNGGRHGRRG